MANSKPFFDLKSGRCSSVVDAMLLRYWEARNVKGGGELMWVDMLMISVVKPQPGDMILNACAAPGGKTLFHGILLETPRYSYIGSLF
ncbi:BnaA02g25130D [Brassica napus]|uniref:BnaA02g25130D protein n=1 Tax=Brassica napus TaxID=3708 RepID=A0A078GWG1_BRANA|nr:BnaA02g25130D [Brassica napus]